MSDLAAVNISPRSLSAWNVHLEAGQPDTGIIGLLTDAAGTDSNPANYSASLSWNGTVTTDLTFAADGTGQWAVLANGLGALATGNYSGSLSVTESSGSQIITTDPANFSIYAASGQGVYIDTTVGANWYGTIATINNVDSCRFDFQLHRHHHLWRLVQRHPDRRLRRRHPAGDRQLGGDRYARLHRRRDVYSP